MLNQLDSVRPKSLHFCSQAKFLQIAKGFRGNKEHVDPAAGLELETFIR